MTSIPFLINNLISATGSDLLNKADSDGFLSFLGTTGTIALIDLFIILMFSVFSWAIILYKFKLINTAKKNSKNFYRIFNRTKHEKLSKIYSAVKNSGESHISNVFQSGYHELVEHCRAISVSQLDGTSKEEIGIKKLNENIHILQRTLSKAVSDEVTRLERGLFFLATTGSTCPFLGLFGTIIGVMNAFSSIGTSGGANLASIAPGISDALITTAAGLIAAIPAAVMFNIFNNSIRILISDMENFSLDFLSLVEKKLS